jgi:hypothetical protein
MDAAEKEKTAQQETRANLDRLRLYL